MKKKIDPRRIIQTVSQVFKPILGKHALRNMILTIIAISLSHKLRINEISRHLPTSVKGEKHKQKRFLRFLQRGLPTEDVMREWGKYVLREVYSDAKRGVIIVDETKLLGPYKAIVAAIPFRKRAIPIYFMVYTDDQIRRLQYLSHNQIVEIFIERVNEILKEALGKKSKKMIWVFDRGFADVKLMERIKDKITFLMRVKKDVWVEVEERCKYAGKLKGFKGKGLFQNVIYHKGKRLRLHLYSDPDKEDPFFVVSNSVFGLHLIYKLRMQIEECFRDLKSLFGFKHLVLRRMDQGRVEMMFALVSICMGLLMMKFEKSAYRWMRELYARRKVYSLVSVIRRVVRDSWKEFRLEPYFSLSPLSS